MSILKIKQLSDKLVKAYEDAVRRAFWEEVANIGLDSIDVKNVKRLTEALEKWIWGNIGDDDFESIIRDILTEEGVVESSTKAHEIMEKLRVKAKALTEKFYEYVERSKEL